MVRIQCKREDGWGKAYGRDRQAVVRQGKVRPLGLAALGNKVGFGSELGHVVAVEIGWDGWLKEAVELEGCWLTILPNFAPLLKDEQLVKAFELCRLGKRMSSPDSQSCSGWSCVKGSWM